MREVCHLATACLLCPSPSLGGTMFSEGTNLNLLNIFLLDKSVSITELVSSGMI